jgi:2-aminoethylphosphonate-pyruvate transaminase
VSPEHQSYIITTFEIGDLDFTKMYDYLKAKRFIVYPGKLTALPTFRIGNIGNVFPDDMKALVSAFGEYITQQ